MSHISSIDLKIRSLDAARAAAEALGLELVEGQKTFRWFGRFVGDSDDSQVLALGIKREDYGKCEHAIRVKGSKKAYEIGLVRDRNGDYVMLFDNWNGGYGLMEKISTLDAKGQLTNANKFKQEYATEVVRREMRAKGLRFREVRQDGRVQIIATVGA